MKRISRIMAEIDFGIESGDLFEWSQWPELLEQYDNHPGLVEGEDTARERLGDPDDSSDEGDSVECDDDDSDDDDDLDGGEDGDCGPVELPDAGSFPAYSEGNSSGSGTLGASSSSAGAAAPAGNSQHSQGDASSYETEVERALRTVARLMEIAQEENLQDLSIKKLLSARLREMQKTKRSQTLPGPLQQKLAERREEEQAKLAKAREAQRAERAEKQKQKKAIELAKLEADAARHKSRAEAKIANAKLAELQLQKQKKQDLEALAKERCRLIKHHFAVKVYDNLYEYVVHNDKKNKQHLDGLWPALDSRMQVRKHKGNYALPAELVSSSRNLQSLNSSRSVSLINYFP